ncbi:MAG: septal ring lytic transglycosylase RlpA family protein [Hyphomicrobiales bacterium]|nr:septal ring lytic transglycosylase RlpA family protein [Hyphomicrobiales bacterium]
MRISSVVLLVALTAAPLAARAECGMASWHGGSGRTASGERWNTGAMVAAHRRRAFGSRVTVTNARNGRSVSVRITDRGPFVRGRIIDLSRAASRQLGINGVGKVCVN